MLFGAGAGQQDAADTVGLFVPPLLEQVVPQDLAPDIGIFRNHGIEFRAEGSRIRRPEPLHHAGIARQVLAEIIQGQQVFRLQGLAPSRRVDLIVKQLVGLHVAARLGIEMSQADGSQIVAVAVVQAVQSQCLAILEVSLRGIEAEREILRSDVHLRLIAHRRVGRGGGQLPQGVHLVELAGHIDIPRSHIAVQFVQQLPRRPVKAAGARTGTRKQGKSQNRQRQEKTEAVHGGRD